MDSPPEQSSNTVPWRHSLRTRVVVGGGVIQALLLLGLALLLYLGARGELLHNSRKETAGLAQQTARGLQAVLDSVQVSGRILAANVGAAGRQPFALRSLLLGTLSGDGDIAGATVIIEPGAFKDAQEAFVWHVERNGDRLKDLGNADLAVDYRGTGWYRRTLADDVAWWSEPYADGDVGTRWLTTYNLPLHLPGDAAGTSKPIGMVSVDVPVGRLQAIVRELPASTGLQARLLSPEGMFVIHPDPSVALRRNVAVQVERRRPDLKPLAEAAAAHRPLSFQHTAADGGRFTTHAIPVGDTGWTFALSASEDFMLVGLNRVARVTAAVATLGLLAWLVLTARFARALSRPIEDITDSAQHFQRGEFDYPLRHLEREDEVGVMARALDAARTSIGTQMTQIEQMTAARERMQSELEIAREIQQAMLPSGRTFDRAHSHLEAFALLEPAKTVGGDFYHFFETEPGLLWFAIGDVSDKGVPAALFMARAVSVLEIAARRSTRPDTILSLAALRLAENNDTCMFATLLCGLIELDSGEYRLASAGHEPPLLVDADGSVTPLPLQSGPPLGIEPEASFPVLSGRMTAGQTLLGYTDGVTDALDPQQRSYGVERLARALRSGRSASEQCLAVSGELRRFIGDADAFDDVTLLAIRLRQEPSSAESASR